MDLVILNLGQVTRTTPELEHPSPNFRTTPRIFLTGHGPFPCYLSRFKILSSPLSECGSLGDPEHYLFDYLMTRDHHLKKPSYEAKSLWLKNLMSTAANHEKLVNYFKNWFYQSELDILDSVKNKNNTEMNCDEDEDDEDGNDHDAEINKPSYDEMLKSYETIRRTV
ncbi:hypothetical protein AVEN_185593-1 [Araneus ventricosus]|uniref:Uncharacterized protein n=1 Tax=Araneus ventricosus TaxID=182803 RepID=A0A4Y2C336_ARAVE|nr:hypothetical protein AVEN_22542-1 [Araneus ventricosus]GBL98555.1 hypothetical protein AVEN_185593-1 [Araneus ventricosus]